VLRGADGPSTGDRQRLADRVAAYCEMDPRLYLKPHVARRTPKDLYARPHMAGRLNNSPAEN